MKQSFDIIGLADTDACSSIHREHDCSLQDTGGGQGCKILWLQVISEVTIWYICQRPRCAQSLHILPQHHLRHIEMCLALSQLRVCPREVECSMQSGF